MPHEDAIDMPRLEHGNDTSPTLQPKSIHFTYEPIRSIDLELVLRERVEDATTVPSVVVVGCHTTMLLRGSEWIAAKLEEEQMEKIEGHGKGNKTNQAIHWKVTLDQ